MPDTRMYREQHANLLLLARQLDPMLEAAALARDARAARALVSRLAGGLRVHLAMEDQSLYPFLLASADANVREHARRFRDDLGRIRSGLAEYLARWPTARAVESEPATFVAHTRELLLAVATRVAREDGELFALVDRLP